jgi:uncharacterized membrane protein (UPF0127 family)
VTRTATITNVTRNTTLATDIPVADTPTTRRVGLLEHMSLPPGGGLYIDKGSNVHTNGMKFPIDLIFIYQPNAVGRPTVTRTVEGVGEGRYEGGRHANSVLELPVGVIRDSGTKAGDWLRVEFT